LIFQREPVTRNATELQRAISVNLVSKAEELRIELLELRKGLCDWERRIPNLSVGHFPIVHEAFLSPDRPLEGILRYLSNECGGSDQMLSKQVIALTSSSDYDRSGQYSVSKLIDPNKETYFHSAHGSGQWISVDFQAMRVSPTHYTLLSRNTENGFNLKSWVLEGSETGSDQDWFEMDIRRDTMELNGSAYRGTFCVKNPAVCRYIRLRSIAPHYGEDYLVLAGLELFGTLAMPNPIKSSA
jgi:hypothetical protein